MKINQIKNVDLKERAEELANALISKMKVQAKKKNVRLADISINAGKETSIIVETNSPEWVGDVLELLIEKSKYGIHVKTIVHPGSFDWAADTYIKDAVEVTFKV